jgi:hypothetical protein
VRATVPTVAKLVVVQVATPEPLTGWEPHPVIVVLAFLKLTVPPGVTPGPVIVAVRVVEALAVVGLGLEVSVVVDVPGLTVRVVEPVEVV